MHQCMHTYMYIAHNVHKHTHNTMHIYIYTHIYIHIYIYIYIYTYIYIHIYIYIYTYIYVYIDIYIYMHSIYYTWTSRETLWCSQRKHGATNKQGTDDMSRDLTNTSLFSSTWIKQYITWNSTAGIWHGPIYKSQNHSKPIFFWVMDFKLFSFKRGPPESSCIAVV